MTVYHVIFVVVRACDKISNLNMKICKGLEFFNKTVYKAVLWLFTQLCISSKLPLCLAVRGSLAFYRATPTCHLYHWNVRPNNK